MGTIAWEELYRRASTIYEAVVIMSRRARQINDEQKAQIMTEMETVPQMDNRESEDFDEVEIDREALMREHTKFPKPTEKAMKEMAQGGIKFRYLESESSGEKV